MKRAIVVLLGSVVLALAACGSTTNSGPGGTSSTPATGGY